MSGSHELVAVSSASSEDSLVPIYSSDLWYPILPIEDFPEINPRREILFSKEECWDLALDSLVCEVVCRMPHSYAPEGLHVMPTIENFDEDELQASGAGWLSLRPLGIQDDGLARQHGTHRRHTPRSYEIQDNEFDRHHGAHRRHSPRSYEIQDNEFAGTHKRQTPRQYGLQNAEIPSNSGKHNCHTSRLYGIQDSEFARHHGASKRYAKHHHGMQDQFARRHGKYTCQTTPRQHEVQTLCYDGTRKYQTRQYTVENAQLPGQCYTQNKFQNAEYQGGLQCIVNSVKRAIERAEMTGPSATQEDETPLITLFKRRQGNVYKPYETSDSD